jgi:DTW domain-containing protein YfiP
VNETECPRCLKDKTLCVCDAIEPLKTKLHVLILQHPQEPDKDLGSARLAHLALANSTLRVGLSWPNLGKALGRQAVHGNWGVLYLGGKGEKSAGAPQKEPVLRISTKSGQQFRPAEAGLEGIVVLDGTWAQAKALWWRNAWLLKLKRLTLHPGRRSLYGKLRKEPRRECLSSIEAIAETLEALGEDAKVGDTLRGHFAKLLEKYKARTTGTAAPQMPDESASC